MINSVEQILAELEKQPGWSKFRDYRQLLTAWHNTVSKNTAKNTRPLHITRQVLWVATNSASRAQELSFQRYTLLKRLNKQLPFVIKDIRFSASGLEQTDRTQDTRQILFTIRQQEKKPKSKNNLRNSHPNDKRIDNTKSTKSSQEDAQLAVKRWLKAIEQKSSKLSLSSCPKCDASTPVAELERWSCCYLCAAQKWSEEYQKPKFPETK